MGKNGVPHMFVWNAPVNFAQMVPAARRKAIIFVCDGTAGAIRGYIGNEGQPSITTRGEYFVISPGQVIEILDPAYASEMWWGGNPFDGAGTAEVACIEIFSFDEVDPKQDATPVYTVARRWWKSR